MNLHLYIYTYLLTINISHLSNYSDFQWAHFLTVHKRITIPVIKPIPNQKPYAQRPRNKTCEPIYDLNLTIMTPYPTQGLPGQGPLRIGHFRPGSRSVGLCKVWVSARPLGQAGLGFIGLCSISFIACSRTLFFS